MKSNTKNQYQHYASDINNNIIHVKDTSNLEVQKYYCPYCNNEMITKRGNVRQWHFAHKTDKCSYDKYLHFKFEKDYKWAGPGEDRNRLFFWTITPFYSRGFFNTAYAIDEHEKNTFFFRNFLYALDPRTCIVGNYNTGMPLMNPLRLRIYGLAEKAVRNPWIRRLGSQAVHFKKGLGTPQRPDPEREKMRTMALDLLEESDLIKEYFSLPELF